MSRPSTLTYLVRHGESEWNRLRLTQGQTAHPALTATGLAQAGRAAALVAADLASLGRRADLVLTSDLRRAAQTASVLADALGCPVREEARLREQHLGELQGRSHDETFAAAGAVDWTAPDAVVPGGETREQVRDRMVAVLGGVAAGSVAVLVSHGDALRPLLAHLGGHPPHLAPWVEVRNGSVARVVGAEVTWLPDPAPPVAAS